MTKEGFEGFNRNLKLKETLTREQVRENILTKGYRLSHDAWRRSRWQAETHTYNPRLKPTSDTVWSEKHGGAQEVDIANAGFDELPSDWQAETRASFDIAVEGVEKALDTHASFDNTFIEGVAAKIHDAWRSRREAEGYEASNPKWAWAVPMMQGYDQISEEEKEKDREFVRTAVQLWNDET